MAGSLCLQREPREAGIRARLKPGAESETSGRGTQVLSEISWGIDISIKRILKKQKVSSVRTT